MTQCKALTGSAVKELTVACLLVADRCRGISVTGDDLCVGKRYARYKRIVGVTFAFVSALLFAARGC